MRAACSARTAAARSITSACTGASTFRWARSRRPWARSAATSRAASRSSSSSTIARGRSCSRRRTRRRSPRPCIAALDVLEQEPQIIERLWDNTRFFKAGLPRLGFNTGLSESPITPVIAGEGALAMKLSDRLFEEGVFAQGIAFPTVARDKARVRTIVTATHTTRRAAIRLGQVRQSRPRTGVDLCQGEPFVRVAKCSRSEKC